MIHFYPAKEIHLYPEKEKKFMTSQEFHLALEKELNSMYIKEGLKVNLTYLGYPCCFIIKNIMTYTLEPVHLVDEEDSELSALLSQMNLGDAEESANDSTGSFLEDLKASQTSTPVVAHKASSTRRKTKRKIKILSPQKCYFIFTGTKIFVKTNYSSEVVRFEDIAGLNESIKFIESAVNSISRRYGMFHLSTPGILLIGPPGSGKSMIGEALKKECHFPVHIIKFREINSYDVKERIRLKKVFEDTSNCSIIFLDDLEMLYKSKQQSNALQKEEYSRTLTELIYNSLNYSSNVLVIATVQNETLLPPHFRKNGFFAKELSFNISSSDRKQILLKILKNYSHLLSAVEIDKIVDLTNGFTAGDIKNLCEKAKNSILQHISAKNGNYLLTLDDIKRNLVPIKPDLPFKFEVPNVRWSDIGGMKKVKDALTEMIDWPIRLTHQFRKFKITPPQGILMYGPPGCCKTMIAKALVTESHLNFIYVKGSELFNKYVGESEKLVSEIFKKARSSTPCVLFFDEIDSMTSTRGSTSGNSNVSDRVVTQLLIEIDGIEPLQGVSILAATNRPDLIDPSFLRPGRFDRRIYVPLPDGETRLEIFKVKLQQLPLSPDVDFTYLSHVTEGYSGAEISEICQEASKCTFLEDVTSTTSVITMKHLLKSLQVVQPKTNEEVKQFFAKYEKKNFFS